MVSQTAPAVLIVFEVESPDSLPLSDCRALLGIATEWPVSRSPTHGAGNLS
jgi:hypothetical protein